MKNILRNLRAGRTKSISRLLNKYRDDDPWPLAPRATGAPEPEEMKNDANQNRRPGAASGLQSLLLAVRSSNQPEPNRPQPNLLKLKKREARSVIPFPPICHFSIQLLAFSLAAFGKPFLHYFAPFSALSFPSSIVHQPLTVRNCTTGLHHSATHDSAILPSVSIKFRISQLSVIRFLYFHPHKQTPNHPSNSL